MKEPPPDAGDGHSAAFRRYFQLCREQTEANPLQRSGLGELFRELSRLQLVQCLGSFKEMRKHLADTDCRFVRRTVDLESV